MNEEILQRLDLLGTKLGVATAHIWEVLVAQAYVEALKAGVWLVLVLGVAVTLALTAKRSWAKINDLKSDGVILAIPLGVLYLGTMILLIVSTSYAIDAVGYALNPEYFALQKLMGVLDGLQ